MIYGWWITTRQKRVLVVPRAWDGRAAKKVFSFQFSGFESLTIPPPCPKSISGPIFTLKRGKFPNFLKKLLSLAAENSPKKICCDPQFFFILFYFKEPVVLLWF